MSEETGGANQVKTDQQGGGDGAGDNQQNVPMSKYVGVKEMLKKEEEAHASTKTQLSEVNTKVQNLEGQVTKLGEELKTAKESGADKETVDGLRNELAETKTKLDEAERKAVLAGHNVDPETVKELSTKELAAFIKGLEAAGNKGGEKPGADLGSGGGGSSLTKARDKIVAGLNSAK